MDTTSAVTLDGLLTQQHDFRPTDRGPIGTLAGLPLRVSAERDDGNKKVLRLWLGIPSAEIAEGVRDALESDSGTLPVKPRSVIAADVGVVVDLPGKLSKAPVGDALAAVEAVVQRAALVPGAARGRSDGAELTTVDGFPRWLTAQEREDLVEEARMMAEAYAAVEPRVGRGLVAGAVGALITAIVWAVIWLIGFQAWFIAIGGGLLIAFLAVRAAGRVTVALQAGIFVLTVLAVLFGEILGVALYISREFGVFDLIGSIEIYLVDVVGEAPGDVLFALGGGLVGAWFGIRSARKPTFERDIENH
jgi:hypothetical protein